MIKNHFKIILRVKGGLGNQLFCYAAARSISIKNNAELIIDNISGFIRDVEYNRSYQLHHFNISGRTANYFERLEPFGRIRRKILCKLNDQRAFSQKTYLTDEKDDIFDELKNQGINCSVILDGYWQNELYFNDIKETIKEELSVIPPKDINNQNYAELISNKNSVAVHVRWYEKGIENSVNTLKLAYYKEAINYCEAYLEKPDYFLFSDDIVSAAKNIPFPEDRLTLVNINTSKEMAYADFLLMSKCKHFIIANSTFSWWAAWLGEQDATMILYPSESFQNSNNWNFIKLVPKRWTKI